MSDTTPPFYTPPTPLPAGDNLGVGTGEPHLPPSQVTHPCGYLSHAPLHPFRRWVSVLQNSKDEALSSAFLAEPSGGGPGPWGGAGLDGEPQDLTKLLIAEVKSRPGNGQCCDCGAAGGPGGVGREEGAGSGGEGPAPPGTSRSLLQTPRGSAPTWACSPASSARASTVSWACASRACSPSPWTFWAPPSCW